MSDAATWPGPSAVAPAREADRTATRPPRPRSGPVLIGDGATQWGGRPMLLHVLDAGRDD